MIKKIELTRFKKFSDCEFDVKSTGVTLLVGGNNSGKSTLIQSLSVWEFCKMILLNEKGRESFNSSSVGVGEGFGISAEEFMPVAVPSLKHLWTNLKTQNPNTNQSNNQFPGYIMRIKCVWDYEDEIDKWLEIGLSLVNDRLFIRVTGSNLAPDDYIPKVVYLPTLAGVLPKENRVTKAERRVLLGRGMAGSVIRNMIYDLYLEDQSILNDITAGSNKLLKGQRVFYEQTSPLQNLQRSLRDVFQSELEIEPFSADLHTMIRVHERKVVLKDESKYEVLPKSKYPPRDIITQGSGYLQWLSIFCVLYSPDIDIIVLDEPDAHLHSMLQVSLLKELLGYIERNTTKQIFVSTHSVEMIQRAPLNCVFSMERKSYLSDESSRVAALHGIGSEYCPQIDKLKRCKKLVFVENESDASIVKILASKCNMALPEDVVYWATTVSHADRKKLYLELRKDIPSLRCVSLRDRDMDNPRVVDSDLSFKGISNSDSSFLPLQWKRKNIESYLLCPKAIARSAGVSEEEVINYFSDNYAISMLPEGYTESDPPEVIITLDGKRHFENSSIGIEYRFGCNKYSVAKNMENKEVCEDIKTFITRTNAFFED